MATLPKIGYHMLNSELVVRNYITEEEVKIPQDFHYLKVVKLNDGDYKLTFCNVLGNEFFEYKNMIHNILVFQMNINLWILVV